mmetsp:Transcript_22638/g.40633  ORF Transcript_22638/g.40633 Transcript_22638/m.40633 type:complete len:267 (+) Transcript_22638:1889-2689(+)
MAFSSRIRASALSPNSCAPFACSSTIALALASRDPMLSIVEPIAQKPALSSGTGGSRSRNWSVRLTSPSRRAHTSARVFRPSPKWTKRSPTQRSRYGPTSAGLFRLSKSPFQNKLMLLILSSCALTMISDSLIFASRTSVCAGVACVLSFSVSCLFFSASSSSLVRSAAICAGVRTSASTLSPPPTATYTASMCWLTSPRHHNALCSCARRVLMTLLWSITSEESDRWCRLACRCAIVWSRSANWLLNIRMVSAVLPPSLRLAKLS